MSSQKDRLIEIDNNELPPPPTYTSLPDRPSSSSTMAPPYNDLDTDLEEQTLTKEEPAKQPAFCGLKYFITSLLPWNTASATAESTSDVGLSAWKFNFSRPQLKIHAAVFADADITSKVQFLVTSYQRLVLDMTKAQFLFGDPWPNTRKTLCILYQYEGQPMQLITTHEEGGIVTIDHRDPIDTHTVGFLQHGTEADRILAVVWGLQDGLKGPSGDYRKRALERLDTVFFTQKWFGFDGYPLGGNSCVVFLRDGSGGVKFVAARENTSCRLPAPSFTNDVETISY
jgi:hypothetical protein